MSNETMTAAAHALPADFLEAVADHAEEALSAWLKGHAPANVARAFDLYNAVRLATGYAREGRLETATDDSLLEYVSGLAAAVTELGGNWYTPTGPIVRPADSHTTQKD